MGVGLLLVGLCLHGWAYGGVAEPVLRPHTVVLAKESPRLSAAEAQARVQQLTSLAVLTPLDTSTTGRGYAYRHVLRWYASPWTNPSAADTAWVFRLRHTYAFDVEAWIGRADSSGRVLSWEPLHLRAHDLPPMRHQLVWAVHAAPGERLVLLYHGGGLFDGPELLPREEYLRGFLADEVWAQAILYVFLAFAVFFLLYNGMLFYSVRQRVFVYYGLYVLGMSSYIWFSSHVAGQWFAERVTLADYNYLLVALLFMGLYGFTVYSRSFISADAVAPRPAALFRQVRWLMVMTFGLGVANLWIRSGTLNGLYNALIGVTLLVIVIASIWAGVLAVRRRSADAWPYALGSAFPVIACLVVAIYLLAGYGVRDLITVMPTLYPMFVGEYLLLSMALGAYIRQTERERDHAQAESIAALEQNQRLIEAHNSELELRVAKRTHDLETSNLRLSQTLEELQSTQEQLISKEKLAALAHVLTGLAHDMNTPIGVCVTAASNLSERTQRVAEATATGQLTRSELDRFAETSTELAQSLVTNLQRVSQLIQNTRQVGVQAEAAPLSALDLQSALAEWCRTNAHPNLQVTFAAGPALACIQAADALEQIIARILVCYSAYASKSLSQKLPSTLSLRLNAQLEAGHVALTLQPDIDQMESALLSEAILQAIDPFSSALAERRPTGQYELYLARQLAERQLEGQLLATADGGLQLSFPQQHPRAELARV